MKDAASRPSARNSEPLRLPTLRQRAEAEFEQRRDAAAGSELSPEAARAALHELQVHQIELEMQNDELQRSRADLEASFTRYFALYEMAPVGYSTVEPQGKILRANLTLTNLLAATKSAVEQHAFTRFLHREDADTFYLAAKAALTTSRRQSFQGRLTPQAGHFIWVLIVLTPDRNLDGSSVLQLAVTDINESHRAEAIVRENEARYQALTESIQEGVATTGPDGIVRTWNLGAARMFGYSAAEAIGRRAETFFRDSEPSVKAGNTSPGFPGRNLGGTVERLGRRQDGSEFPAECSTTEWNHGGERFWTTIIRDGSERKQSDLHKSQIQERLQQTHRLESLGVLAGGLAHDLNNFLGGIMNSAELAGRGLSADSTLVPHLTTITDSARLAADICRQLLASSGQGPVALERLALNTLVRETAERLKYALGKGTEIRQHLAEHLPPVRGDATQIRQTIMNLIINASEALQRRSGRVTLTTLLTSLGQHPAAPEENPDSLPPGDYVCLLVSDTGSGMDAATLSRIFDPFFTTKQPGRGLGLSSAHGTAIGHNGSLTCTSVPGTGTTFRLMLPCAEAETPTPSVGAPASPHAWRQACRILVVDDDETMRRTTAEMLLLEGFDVVTAVDGREAVDIFQAAPDRFNVVVSDVTMPRLTGDKACAEMKLVRPGLKCILMSGYRRLDFPQPLNGESPCTFITKPFSYQELLQAIERTVLS